MDALALDSIEYGELRIVDLPIPASRAVLSPDLYLPSPWPGI
jgi:hypothetical protein